MIYVIIRFNGRIYWDIEINETDTIKIILDKFYNKISMPQQLRFYEKEKVIFRLGDICLNCDNDSLNKTAEEIEINDDDILDLIRARDLQLG